MASIILEKRDRVAYVTFNRPAQLNSITEDAIAELDAAVAALQDDDDLVALVIRGTGHAFCVGLDIELLDRAFADPPYFESVLRRFGGLLLALEALEIPVIAAVNGLARAGGFEMMLACDLVIASQQARISDGHTSFGVLPGGGSTQRLPRKIGGQRAKELIMTARWLTADEALAYGLVSRAVPGDQLETAVEELLEDLRSKPSSVLRAVKRAMNRGSVVPLTEALDIEIEEFLRHLTTESSDAVEGFTAYREGRPPQWRHR